MPPRDLCASGSSSLGSADCLLRQAVTDSTAPASSRFQQADTALGTAVASGASSRGQRDSFSAWGCAG